MCMRAWKRSRDGSRLVPQPTTGAPPHREHERKDILNMEETKPSFQDGRMVLSDRAPLAVI